MKSEIIFIIIILLAVFGCQSIKKNDSFALVVTPIDLSVTKVVAMPYDGPLSLYDYLKNKKIRLKIISNDPFIYEIQNQKGLLEELAKILRTVRTVTSVCNLNLANINTTKTEDNKTYRRKMIIISKDYEAEKIVDVPGDFKPIFDPVHPDADEKGYLYLPNVNLDEEKYYIMKMQSLENAIIKIIEKINKNSVVIGSTEYYKVYSSQ